MMHKKTKGTPMKHVRTNSEQAILDACWLQTSLGDKVKTKIMERIARDFLAISFHP